MKSIDLPSGAFVGSAGLQRLIALVVLAALGLALRVPAQAQTLEELRQMSIEDLGEINVSSVSKTDQPLGDAAAAIYVISREEIIRSGAVTLPEMLRLAPNLQVYQTSPSEWVVTARGLNGNREAQSYSNKLLVLVDGRTVYTPLFSGVYWDMPDILPDNIDRIEVISGPGATLWGANAVNGVINVITRNSYEVDGFHVDARAGPDRQAAGLRYAGRAGEQVSFSLHGRYLREEAYLTSAGVDAQNGWERLGGGFRLDWTPSDLDTVSLQGDGFDGHHGQPGGSRETFSGHNLALRWTRQSDGAGELQAQLLYDRIARDDAADGGGRFHTRTFDAEVQHSFLLGQQHQLVLGGGVRLVGYKISGTPNFFFEPAERDLVIANAFVQDRFILGPELTLIAGLKIEHLPYVGTQLLPELRMAWKPAPTTLVWGSAARAVRSPTPFDVDVEERVENIISLSGNPDFRTEKLTALELGTRIQPTPQFSLSATLFWHRYDDLRSIELVTGTALLPLGWGNQLQGETYGVEAWIDLKVANWWKVTAGATVLERDFTFDEGSSELLGTGQLGNDPPYWVTASSSMNLSSDLTLDLDFRAVGALRDAAVPAYQELGARLAWRIAQGVTLSFSGTNLLNDRHQEYPGGDVILRRVMGGVELGF